MLLSRMADSLYWISRYLERAEHTARVVGVAVDIKLGRASSVGTAAVERLYASLGLMDAAHGFRADTAFFDPAHPNSVISLVTVARENARQVREGISSEMWEQLNALYLRLKQMREDAAWTGRTHYLARTVMDGIHLFQGVTDATMDHGEGWQYLQVGRYLERASATAALLDLFVADARHPLPDDVPLDQAEWVALLRSCSAREAYYRHYTADVRSERVAEFLLLNAEFPRSVRFASGRVESALLALGRWSGRRAGGRAERLAGRLHALLDYGQLDEILSDGSHAYLTGIGDQCAQIHAAVYQTYLSYPIETALPA
jgi:uncharacterized alpha-E superfamily protein